MKKIYFYVPPSRFEQIAKIKDHSDLLGFHDRLTSEIIPTYLYMKQSGFNAEIIDHLPEEGIVVSDRESFFSLLIKRKKYFSDMFDFPTKVMLVTHKSDSGYLPPVHINIVLNPVYFEQNSNDILHNPYYLPSFPQPGLIPRLKQRDCLVQNVSFFGHHTQLTKEFNSEKWHSELASLGCNWIPTFDRKKWGDYREIDVVVTIRSFDQYPYLNKPANKLINCWRTGVPAIVASESANLALKKTDLDFCLADSLDETILAVKNLKNNPELYSAMVQNGLKRAEEFTVEQVLIKWIKFFEEYAYPTYEKWLKLTDLQKKTLFWRRYLAFKLHRQIVKYSKERITV